MKPLKRLERYFSAIFTLGRIKGLAKDAHRNVAAVQPRVDHLEDRAAHFENQTTHLEDRTGHLEGRTDHLEDQATHLEDRTGHLKARADQVDRDLRAQQASLDAIEQHLKNELRHLTDWTGRHEALAEELVAEYRREVTTLQRTGQSDTALLARMFSDLSRRLDQMPAGKAGKPPPAKPAKVDLPDTDGFDLFKDNFYHRLENRYRGTPEEISKRLKIYLPDVEAAWLRTGKLPVMDIGCGRGEWLGLLKGQGIDGFGIDTNAVQIEEAKEAGLDVRLGDALAALAALKDNSLSALTAHHLIEHLPFDAVAWITREAMRVLAPGGLLLFETPNTRNVLVGATTFHTDPTHLKPMPEQVMGILFETAGFDPIDIRGLNPHERFGEFLDKPDFNDELAFLMFGPQDLAILGTKPKDS